MSVFDTQGNFLGQGRIAGDRSMRPGEWPSRPPPSASLRVICSWATSATARSTPSTSRPTPSSASFTGADGKPLVIDGLWGLTVGNDAKAGSSQSLYFSAGPQRRIQRPLRRHQRGAGAQLRGPRADRRDGRGRRPTVQASEGRICLNVHPGQLTAPGRDRSTQATSASRSITARADRPAG